MILDYIGILIMAVLGGARLSQILAGEWWALPLFAHAVISAFLLIFRGKTSRRANLAQLVTAWVSALLPFAVQVDGAIPLILHVLSLLGVVFAVWVLVVLGSSFDVSPADRGLVVHGPYTLIRHPMYASELFSTMMIVLADLSIWNVAVLITLITTIVLRICWEETIISNYAKYSDRVRTRLLPGVW